MRSRSLFRYLSHSHCAPHSSSRLPFVITQRYQSSEWNISPDSQINVLESDESILGELETFELSEAELTKISDSNGATIIDGVEYLQASGLALHRIDRADYEISRKCTWYLNRYFLCEIRPGAHDSIPLGLGPRLCSILVDCADSAVDHQGISDYAVYHLPATEIWIDCTFDASGHGGLCVFA